MKKVACLVFAFLTLWGCSESNEIEVKDEVVKSKEAKITSFKEGSIVYELDESTKKITYTYPNGTDVTALSPTIEVSVAATVNPASGEAQDFSKAVKYVVTAEDGTTKQTYVVNVVVKKNNEAKITSFKEGDNVYTIDEEKKEITHTYPYGTNVSALTPTIIVSDKATVTPAVGELKDFSSPVKYVVTAEDGKTKQTYTVLVTVAKNNEAKIISFEKSWDRYKIDESRKEITFTYPVGTDVRALTPTVVVSSGATVVPISGLLQDFTNPVKYVVTAEDGITQQTYTVIVTVTVKETVQQTANGIIKLINSAEHNPGDKVTFQGKEYTVVDKTLLKTMVTNKEYDKLPYVVTSKITDMTEMFKDATDFNGDISTWDVSNVTNTSGMFQNATIFNRSLSSWDVSKVTNTSSMFKGAAIFNGDLSNWNVSKVSLMSGMFDGASKFNQNISSWQPREAQFIAKMFNNATDFDQDISSWCTTKSITSFEIDNFATGSPIVGTAKEPTWGTVCQ